MRNIYLCLRRLKKRVKHGMFKLFEGECVRFKRTQEVALLGGKCSTGWMRESRREGKDKSTKLALEIIALWDTLTRV